MAPGSRRCCSNAAFRSVPDWEAVLTPVLDGILARSDVATDRVAVIGVGRGVMGSPVRWHSSTDSPPPCWTPGSSTSRVPGPIGSPTRCADNCANSVSRRSIVRCELAELFAPSTTETIAFTADQYGYNGGCAFRALRDNRRLPPRRRGPRMDTPVLDYRVRRRTAMARPVPAAVRPPAADPNRW